MTIIRPSITTFLLAGLLSSPAVITLGVGRLSVPVGVFVCVYVFAVLGTLVGQSVSIGEGKMIYSRFLRRSRVITIANIKAAEFRVGATNYRERFLPMYRLEIVEEGERGQEKIVIGLKAFSRKDVLRIVKTAKRDGS